MDEFAITIKRTGNNSKNENDYDDYFTFLRKSNPKCELHKWVYEDNVKEPGVHIHGVLRVPKGYFRKRLCPVNGSYHVKLVKITDLEGWIRYMRKDKIFRDNIFQIANMQTQQCEEESEIEHEEYIDIEDYKGNIFLLAKRNR